MDDSSFNMERILSQVVGKHTRLGHYRVVASGNNKGLYLESDRGVFFLKTNVQRHADIFVKETSGLDLLRRNTFLTIPRTWGQGRIDGLNYLLMEWIPSGRRKGEYWEVLARGLARLHRTTHVEFGLYEDNYIAVLSQTNSGYATWPEFFIENRLEKMLILAHTKGHVDKAFMERFRRIYPIIPSLFPTEKPALLHGDLWSGNLMTDGEGNPALIDPAVYFGHREMDLAFSKLFAGFSERFYAAYEEDFPIAPGFEERQDIYNLYPLLVHLNLFGRSYLAAIDNTVNRLV